MIYYGGGGRALVKVHVVIYQPPLAIRSHTQDFALQDHLAGGPSDSHNKGKYGSRLVLTTCTI